MIDGGPGVVRVAALSGGVGGAKLVLGLSHLLAAGELLAVVNTGDDFEHLGLLICPDVDSVVYALAGLADPERGWGRADESWHFLDAIGALGGPTWFRLGDRDLAMHVERTRRIRDGERLSAVMARICRRLGVAQAVVPATDGPLRTIIETERGPMALQQYLVHEAAGPAVRSVRYDGADRAAPAPGVLAALADPALEAVVLCPSNPFISIDPILAVPGIRDALAAGRAPVVGVSPIVGGAAVKGPAAKMMREMGMDPGPLAVAERYRDVLDGFVIDRVDERCAPAIAGLGIVPRPAHTMMRSLGDRIALAATVLDLARDVGAARDRSDGDGGAQRAAARAGSGP